MRTEFLDLEDQSGAPYLFEVDFGYLEPEVAAYSWEH